MFRCSSRSAVSAVSAVSAAAALQITRAPAVWRTLAAVMLVVSLPSHAVTPAESRPSAASASASASAPAPAARSANTGNVSNAGNVSKSGKSAKAARAWRTLSPAGCHPLNDAEQARLPASWKPYASSTRRCDLAAPGAAPKVSLVSVFAEDYFRGSPPSAPWEDFPKPLLVDSAWRCVGVLPELYPFDEPRTLTLRYGQWLDGIPQEIRVQVANPALGGDYALPPLSWDAAQQRYHSTPTSNSVSPQCPQS
jgi:hypothetical protein